MLAVATRMDDEVPEADETDAGPRARANGLERQCIATRTVVPVAQMLRFVVGPDGAVVPDLSARLPGRGAWVTATRGALAEALKRKAFGRAFRGKARVEAGLAERIDALMEKDTLAALGLANKAGRVVAGTTKVTEALRAGTVAVLVHATEAAEDGTTKLDGLAMRLASELGREIATIGCLPGLQLDLALGRPNVVHAALLAHPTSAGFLARCRRLERWRAD
ncbi:MAG TPA: RNA-binding protein [Xanthobacteraceae bacterium]|nr:RNA-binding protein [Xanthobacteraceae bacterium]